MLDAQSSLGSAARDEEHFGDAAMGRCLNATLPEDQHDRQPLTGGDGRYAFVADIRLDNRVELIADLTLENTRAREMADSAIALAAWEQWGTASFDRLIGDWAIVIWDRQDREMILARDPVGMRPLHYHRGKGQVAISTMPAGLHALEDVPREVDQDFLAASLMMAQRSDESCPLRHIRRVVPGHFTRINAGGTKTQRFWSPPTQDLRLLSHKDYVDAAREVFDRAVADRLRGCEGHIATQLSGGLDSSAVTEAAARLISSGKLTAYTARPRIDFAEEKGDPSGRFSDEWSRAQSLTKQHSNIEHIGIRADDRSILSALNRFTPLSDRPAIAPANLPWTIAINQHAQSAGHAIMLTGQTGNLTFSYAGDALYLHRLRRLQLLTLARELTDLPKGRAKVVMRQAFRKLLPPKLQSIILQTRHGLEDHGVNPILAQRYASTKRREEMDRLSAMKRFFSQVEYGAVMKAHLAGWGLEYRDPTSDRHRSLARSMLKGHVPDLIRLETNRGLQAADWQEALALDAMKIGTMLDEARSDEVISTLFDIPSLQSDLGNLSQVEQADALTLRRYRTGLLRAMSIVSFTNQAGRA